MRKDILYSIFLCICLLLSCNNRTHNTGHPDISDIDRIVIRPTTDDEVILYSQLFSCVEYIPLETTDESLLAGISKLEILDDGRILVFDGDIGAVYVFEKGGRFLWKIGNRGNASNEYVSVKDVALDKYNNQVVILDSGTNRLLFYDIEGHFLSSLELTCFPSSISVMDSDYLCLFLNYTETSWEHSICHNIKIINRRGEVRSELLEYNGNIRNFHPAYEKVFCLSEDTLYLMPPYSSVIYNVSSDALVPAFSFDLGENGISEETFVDVGGNYTEYISIMQRGVFMHSFLKSPNYLFLRIADKGSIYLCVVNTDDPRVTQVSTHTKNDLFGYVSSLFPMTAKGNKCYYIIESSDFVRCKKTIEKNEGAYYDVIDGKIVRTVPQPAEMKLLNSVHEGDNPIIQVCTLRNREKMAEPEKLYE